MKTRSSARHDRCIRRYLLGGVLCRVAGQRRNMNNYFRQFNLLRPCHGAPNTIPVLFCDCREGIAKIVQTLFGYGFHRGNFRQHEPAKDY
jgi:hypothetical protein